MLLASPTDRRRRLALSLLVVSLFLLQLGLSLPALTPARAAAIPNTDIDPYGVNTFLDKEVEPWKKERTMQMINQAGVKWIKQLFGWNEIETKKGYFQDDKFNKSAWEKYDQIVDLANKYDIQVVARIDQTPTWANPPAGCSGCRPANAQDYADFLKAFAQHYKGKIHYIQVWNEPNLEGQWVPGQPVNPGQYVQMLKLSYKAIKDVDPSIKVMAAPLAITNEEKINLNELKYLDQMYKADAKDYFDIMPANAYGLEYPPEAAPAPNVLNYRRVELLHDVMVKNGDTNKAVWFNEYGWNASPQNVLPETLKWRRVTEQQQADYTVKGIQYARDHWPWAGVIFVWFFRQVGDMPDNDSEQYFQLVTKDFAPKPVYNSLKQAALQYLQKSNLPTPAPVVPAAPPTTPASGSNPASTPDTNTGGNNPVATTDAAGNSANTAASGSATTAAATTVGLPSVAATAKPATGNQPTVVAAVPKATPAGTSGLNTNTNPDNGGSILVPLLIGGVLILGAGGGLGYWFLRRRQGL